VARQERKSNRPVQNQLGGRQNFLVRTIHVQGNETTTDGWEIIGWDPVRQQIRSWIFDSNGGFGETIWVNNGDDWLIRASNVLPDGSRSTAENVLTKVDDNKFTWDRKIERSMANRSLRWIRLKSNEWRGVNKEGVPP